MKIPNTKYIRVNRVKLLHRIPNTNAQYPKENEIFFL